MMWSWYEFRMHVWNVLHAARCKQRTQKYAKNRPLRTIAQLCRTISSELRHVSTIGKKLVKQQHVLHKSWTLAHYRLRSVGEFGAPQLISTGFTSWLRYSTAAMSHNGSQPNFARCLAVSWAGTLYIHFRRLLPPNGILPGAKFKFTLCPSLAFSYIGSVTARQSSSGRQPNCGVGQGRELRNFRSCFAVSIFCRAAITL